MSYLGDVMGVYATVGTLVPLSTPLVIQGDAECTGNFQVDSALVLSGGNVQGGFGVNGDVYPFNTNINNLGESVNYWSNFYTNTAFLGGSLNINSAPLLNIIQSGDPANPAIFFAGTGTGGGATDNTNGFVLALSVNDPTNRQFLFGSSVYLGTTTGVLRIISQDGRGDQLSTYIDCCPGDISAQYPVPFANSIITLDDGGGTCGNASNRWSAVYAINPLIQTSALDSKKDIQDSELGLGFINQLKPKSWTWKELPNAKIDLDQIHHGFIYEDVASIAPENFGGIHSANGKGTDGLSYTSFIAPLVKAIQELSAEVKILKALVNA